jgi:F0F1-type ATP synthase membrane subunit c/vacuolar-type H+-ATPase subunit K
MANPFQRYQSGGFEPVQGISQAGANIGQMLGSGFANFGSSIAQGIKVYSENKAKKDAAQQEAEIFGSQLLQTQNALIEASGVDAETANKFLSWDGEVDDELDTDALKAVGDNPFLRKAKMLQPALDKLQKIPTMGLSASLSTLNAAKGSFAMMEQQDKLDAMVAQARLEREAANLPDAVQRTRKVMTGDVGVDANQAFFDNVAQIRDSLVAKFPDDPARVEAGVRDYLKKVEAGYQSADITPEQKAEFAASLKQYNEGLKTNVGDLTPTGESYEYQDESARQDKLQQETIMSLAKEKAKAADAEELLAQRAAGKLKKEEETKAAVTKFGSNLMADVKNTLDDAVIKGQELTPRQLLGVIAGKEYSQSPSGPAVNVTQVRPRIGMGGAGMPGGGGFSGFEKRETNPNYKPSPAFEQLTKTINSLGVDMNKPLDEVAMFKIRKALGIYEEKNKEASAATAKKAENITTQSVRAEMEKRAEPPAAKSKPFSVGPLDLGEETYDQFLTAVEKESAAREFYKAKFGAVPVGFTDMYRKMYPESAVRTSSINVNGQEIPIMIDAKGNVTPLTKGAEAPDVEKVAKAKALTFNNTEIADGVRLSGVFAGTVDGAQTFRKDYARAANVRTAIQELMEINEMGYETLSPTARARADQLQSEVIAALRTPIIGPGQVAIYEQEILQDIVKKGTGFFTLESSERAALKGLMNRVDRELVNWPKSMGLEVQVSGNRSQTIRQLRLNRETKARIVGETN